MAKAELFLHKRGSWFLSRSLLNSITNYGDEFSLCINLESNTYSTKFGKNLMTLMDQDDASYSERKYKKSNKKNANSNTKILDSRLALSRQRALNSTN